jgi:hypothetical protein
MLDSHPAFGFFWHMDADKYDQGHMDACQGENELKCVIIGFKSSLLAGFDDFPLLI